MIREKTIQKKLKDLESAIDAIQIEAPIDKMEEKAFFGEKLQLKKSAKERIQEIGEIIAILYG